MQDVCAKALMIAALFYGLAQEIDFATDGEIEEARGRLEDSHDRAKGERRRTIETAIELMKRCKVGSGARR